MIGDDKEAENNKMQKVMNSFVKIYGAIRLAQNQAFELKKWLEQTKINTVPVNIAYKKIQALSKLVTNSRTSDAWKLAKEHSDHCTSQNKSLIVEIRYSAFSRSRFFSSTKFNGETIYRASTLKDRIAKQELDLNKVTEGSGLHRIMKTLG